MATEQELLQIEKDAQALKENLTQLLETIGSYSTAKDSLSETQKGLAQLVSETQQLTNESHQLIRVAREIGSAQLLDKLSSIDKIQNDIQTALTNMQKKHSTQLLIVIAIATLSLIAGVIGFFV